MTDIFITSFYRKEFTRKSLRLIKERTEPGTYQIHIFDNGSDKETTDYLYSLLKAKEIASLHLDSRNTGCLYNKGIFHMMVESDKKYYVVSDNDVYPPKLEPDWLSRMTSIMDKYPQVAFLAPQLPPIQLQSPYAFDEDIALCEAVGNTFKMVRRDAFPLLGLKTKLMAFGDDGEVCKLVKEKGYHSAFCRDIYCYHAGQCENWGYNVEQINEDPRKAGYSEPFIYPIKNEETFEPIHELTVNFYIDKSINEAQNNAK